MNTQNLFLITFFSHQPQISNFPLISLFQYIPPISQTLFIDLEIMKFDQINTYLIGIFTYKAFYKLLPSSFSNYFTKKQGRPSP